MVVWANVGGEESRSLSLEGRIPDSVVTELEARGQDVSVVRDYDDTMGHAQTIRIHPDGTLEGGADPRGDGARSGTDLRLLAYPYPDILSDER